MDKGKQPFQGDWVSVAKKAKEPQAKFYVVFSGHQPGIYTNWYECQQQTNGVSGSCFQSFDTLAKARRAYYGTPPTITPNRQFARTPPVDILQTSKQDESEVKDFFNPGIDQKIYSELNGVWKNHIVDNKAKFRKHMSSLALNLAEQTAKLKNYQTICFEIMKQMNWEEDFNFEKINNFLKLSDLISNEFSDPLFERIKRICLFEKAKALLPRDNFFQIRDSVEDHRRKIKNLLLRSANKINYSDGIPKITLFLNHEEWFYEDIDWGIANQVIFQSLDPVQWIPFPQMIKSMLSYVAKGYKWSKYFTFWISSSVGWREREKFFQPYQIWYLKPTEDFEFEDDIRTTDNVDTIERLSCDQYWIDSLLVLSRNAKDINGSTKLPFMITDGKRLFVTHHPITYQPSAEQTAQAEQLLLKLNKRDQLDLPTELALTADEVEEFRFQQDSQDPCPSEANIDDFLDEEGYQNLINKMED